MTSVNAADDTDPEIPVNRLSTLPNELRDMILFFALPEAYALPISWDATDIRQVQPTALVRDPRFKYIGLTSHKPIPLRAVSKFIRKNALDVLYREIPIEVWTPDAFAALLSRHPVNPPPSPAAPRDFHLHIFSNLEQALRDAGCNLSFYQVPPTRERANPNQLFSHKWTRDLLNPWIEQLARLPSDTKTVVLDISSQFWRELNAVQTVEFVQRTSTRLWRTMKGKVTVQVIGRVPLLSADGSPEEGETLERFIFRPARR